MGFGTVAASLLFVFALFAGLAMIGTQSNQANIHLAQNANQQQQEFLQLINTNFEIGNLTTYFDQYGGLFVIEVVNTGSTSTDLSLFDIYIDGQLWNRSSVLLGGYIIDSGQNEDLLDPQESQTVLVRYVNTLDVGLHYIKVVSPIGRAEATVIEIT